MIKAKKLFSLFVSLVVLFGSLQLSTLTVEAGGYPSPTITITNVAKTDVTSPGGNDGTITVTTGGAIAGTVEYATTSQAVTAIEATLSPNMTWTTSSSVGSTHEITGLSPGTYYVYVRDSAVPYNVVKHSSAVVIADPSAVTIDSTTSTAVTSYGGSDGKITIIASGGDNDLEYSTDSGVTWQNNNVYTGIPAGTYTVKARDTITLVSDSDSVTVTQTKKAVTITNTTSTAVTTYGGSDGTITITATGGDTTLEYSIDSGSSWQDSNVFTGVSAGTFTVKAKDKSTGQYDSDSVSVTQPMTAVTITSTTSTAVTTYGGSDGTITITATGGDTTLEYSINSGTSWQEDKVFTGVSAGTFTVKARDKSTKLDDSSTVTVTQPDAPSTNVPVMINETYTTAQAVSVWGGNDGKIYVMATGGNNPLVYSKDGGVTWQDSNIFTGLTAGSYTVKAKDPQTKLYDSYVVVVTQPAKPSSGGGSSSSSTSSGGGTVPATNVTTSQSSSVSSGVVSSLFAANVKNAEGETVAKVNLKANAKGESVVGIPASFQNGKKVLEVVTDNGVVVKLPNGVFKDTVGGSISLEINEIDDEDIAELMKSNPEKAKALQAIAKTGKPIIDISLLVGGVVYEDFSGNAEIEIVIPYTPTEAELKNPNSVVTYYLNDAGELIPLSLTNYDPARGGVVLRTKHLSYYGVQYNLVDFNDLANYGWAKSAVSAMAARKIILGVGPSKFAPGENISRADFAVMIARFFDLDEAVTNNFGDIGSNTYYYDAIGNLKALGIVTGVGNNMYKPMDKITRQDMMVILHRTLKVLGRTGEITNQYTNAIAGYKDTSDVSSYASDSVTYMLNTGLIEGNNKMISPKNNTLRSEVAVILGRVLNEILN